MIASGRRVRYMANLHVVICLACLALGVALHVPKQWKCQDHDNDVSITSEGVIKSCKDVTRLASVVPCICDEGTIFQELCCSACGSFADVIVAPRDIEPRGGGWGGIDAPPLTVLPPSPSSFPTPRPSHAPTFAHCDRPDGSGLSGEYPCSCGSAGSLNVCEHGETCFAANSVCKIIKVEFAVKTSLPASLLTLPTGQRVETHVALPDVIQGIKAAFAEDAANETGVDASSVQVDLIANAQNTIDADITVIPESTAVADQLVQDLGGGEISVGSQAATELSKNAAMAWAGVTSVLATVDTSSVAKKEEVVSPTPAPTLMPTPQQQPDASAEDDPHVTSLAGERFAMGAPSLYTLLRLPKNEQQPALLEISANITEEPLEPCKLYMRSISLAGEFMQGGVAQVLPLARNQPGSNAAGNVTGRPFSLVVQTGTTRSSTAWERAAKEWKSGRVLGPNVSVRAVEKRELKHFNEGEAFDFVVGSTAHVIVQQAAHQALNLKLSGIGGLGATELGGLLGTDKHSSRVEEPTEACRASRTQRVVPLAGVPILEARW